MERLDHATLLNAAPAPPRVWFITRKWGPAMGGMETYCERLTKELGRMTPLEVIALPGRADGSPPHWCALMLFPMMVLRRWLARETTPDILHLGDMAIWPLGLLTKISRQPVRAILSAHGTDVGYHRRGGLKGRLYGFYLKLGARLLRDATVIANSAATAAAACETGWRKAEIVSLATDMPTPKAGVAQHDTILFAGRLVERKGCGWFIRNVLPLLPEYLTLEVAGTVWDESENAALDHPRIRFLGPLPPGELAERYARSLCVIVPNIAVTNGEFEGFGLVACEAAVAGGVVLAAHRDGLREAVINGETGYHLTSGDARSWADRIHDVTTWSPDRRERFIAGAKAAAKYHYSWPRVARETLDAYRLETVR